MKGGGVCWGRGGGGGGAGQMSFFLVSTSSSAAAITTTNSSSSTLPYPLLLSFDLRSPPPPPPPCSYHSSRRRTSATKGGYNWKRAVNCRRSSGLLRHRTSVVVGLFFHRSRHAVPETRCRISRTAPFPSSIPSTMMRRITEVTQVPRSENSEQSNRKAANLFAKRKERIKLPDYGDSSGRTFPISEFLSHPSGVESVLNTRALQSFQPLDSNTYRCTLQKIQFLKFEVAPVIDLRVALTSEDCTVEMLSCKFEGSETLEQQNHNFSAFMRNHITWEADSTEPCLDFDVNLSVTLEVYTKPFSLLPISAVESPGNLIMQALIDRLVPLLIRQLLEDYRIWVEEQLKVSS